jgi:hypothetical protein
LTVADADTIYSKNVPEGVVFRQRPAAGTRVLPDTTVRLTVSLGPNPDDMVDTVVEPDTDTDSPAPEEKSAPDVVEPPAENAVEQSSH